MVKKVYEEIKRCVKCGSKLTYVRLKDNSRVCRSCGHIEKLEDKE
jgi:rRNA maturation endonuclease Nob1